jgi:hypothetical protein
MTAVRDLPAEQRRMELPDHQLAHIEEVIDRLQGYEHWSVANDMADGEPRLDQLMRAYDLTYASCRAPTTKNRESAHNNCLYFVIDALRLSRALGLESRTASLRNRIEEHMEALTAGRQLELIFDPFVVHTIAYARDFLDDGPGARVAAKRTMRLLAGTISPPAAAPAGATAMPNVLKTLQFSAEKSASMIKSALEIEDRWDPGTQKPPST